MDADCFLLIFLCSVVAFASRAEISFKQSTWYRQFLDARTGRSWPVHRHAKKIIDEEDRIRKLVADQNYGTSHLTALDPTALHGLGEMQSVALAASQRLAEEDRVRHGQGTFHIGALAASRSIAEEERFKHALGGFHSAALAAHHSIEEEERLRRKIDVILGG